MKEKIVVHKRICKAYNSYDFAECGEMVCFNEVSEKTTTNPDLVTCKNCLKIMNKEKGK
jgi:hypothetical protein